MDIFTTALGLTKQHNGIAMTRFMVEEIIQKLGPDEMNVFEVFGVPGNYTEDHIVDLKSITIRRFNYNDHLERQETDISQFIEAIKTGKPIENISEVDHIKRIVIPVPSEHGPLRLVVISGTPENPEERTVLFQVVELYNSLISLHDSHERDQLTGLLNRHTFNDYYERTATSLAKSNSQMYLGICDIDHFKRVNDTYGHLFGDEVLLTFSRIMEDSFRFNDALFRFGGEEFIVLIKADSPENAESAFDRLRFAVETHVFPGIGQITVSIGFVQCAANQFPNTVIGKADIALYHAKEHGRNQVIDYDNIEYQSAAVAGDIDLF